MLHREVCRQDKKERGPMPNSDSVGSTLHRICVTRPGNRRHCRIQRQERRSASRGPRERRIVEGRQVNTEGASQRESGLTIDKYQKKTGTVIPDWVEGCKGGNDGRARADVGSALWR